MQSQKEVEIGVALIRVVLAEKRELVFKEEGQEYAQVVRMLGNGRLKASCFDGEDRMAHVRGVPLSNVITVYGVVRHHSAASKA